jgi:hypothetical protein
VNASRTVSLIAEELRLVVYKPSLAIWALYLFLLPVYVFSSGLPQPGDVLILALLPAALVRWNGRMSRQAARPLRALAAFVVWCVVINYAWMIVLGKFALLGKDSFVLIPMFYVYNAAILLAVLVLHQRHGEVFLRVTLHMVLVTAVVQVGLSFVLPQGDDRHTVLFNNPNQLGLYALLSANILAFGRRRLGFGSLKSSVGLVACLYLAVLSASKAALVGSALLLLIALVNNPRTILLAALAMVGLLSFPNALTRSMERTSARIAEKQELGFFDSRGYDRIWNHKEYWIIGAGEGGLTRFKDTSVIGDHELHSSAGTLFFCYGFVGVALFLSFLLRVVEGATVRNALMLLPSLAYGLAHQGLRFTLFWILIGAFICLKEQLARPARFSPGLP